MEKNNLKKQIQLGMPVGTASARLRKSILFSFLLKCNENICFQCKQVISNVNDLSIEHKIPWLDSENPISLFFDLDNISFSHLTCNIGAARQTKKTIHPSHSSYRKGCRCDDCKEIEKNRRRVQRQKGINT